MKKFVKILSALMLTSMLTVSTFATTISFKGQKFNTPTILKNGTLMIPARTITSKLGIAFKVEPGYFHFENGDSELILNVNRWEDYNCWNTQFHLFTSPVPAIIEKGTGYVPLRTFVNTFYYDLSFDSKTNTYYIIERPRYWTKNDPRQHVSPNCKAMSKKETVISGTEAQAGSRDKCSACRSYPMMTYLIHAWDEPCPEEYQDEYIFGCPWDL